MNRLEQLEEDLWAMRLERDLAEGIGGQVWEDYLAEENKLLNELNKEDMTNIFGKEVELDGETAVEIWVSSTLKTPRQTIDFVTNWIEPEDIYSMLDQQEFVKDIDREMISEINMVDDFTVEMSFLKLSGDALTPKIVEEVCEYIQTLVNC